MSRFSFASSTRGRARPSALFLLKALSAGVVSVCLLPVIASSESAQQVVASSESAQQVTAFSEGTLPMVAPAVSEPPALGLPPRLLSIGGLFLQDRRVLKVETDEGAMSPGVNLVSDHGFAAFDASELRRLGWELDESDGQVGATWPGGGARFSATTGTPFMSWNGDGVHLAQAPYSDSGRFYLPLQVLVDVLPWKMPRVFSFDTRSGTLRIEDPPTPQGTSPEPRRAARRVVVIDPGHGGVDPGAKGRGGLREKDVALAIALDLARILGEDPGLDVHLTRDRDELIPLWKRGEIATEWRGDQTGVFVSIHANALPNSSRTRGFETYFLSEARTDHERRVVALENAAQEFEENADPQTGSDLSFILTELRNLDHQHWSALLAELIQDDLAEVHPGPNRGVKQGPFAVITNALMPAVLVEVGFVTNPEEERLLNGKEFQADAAQAIANAIREFFHRYPTEGGQ